MPLNGILQKENPHDKVPEVFLRPRLHLHRLHLQEDQLIKSGERAPFPGYPNA